jgi:hypothetical protein
MATLTVLYTPGYIWVVGELVTIDKLNLAANPTIQIVGTINSASIGAGAVGPTQLNASVAGAGLTGGGGVALAVAADGSTLEVVGGVVRVKAAGITADKLVHTPFLPASPYMSGTPGEVPAPPASKTRQFLRDDGWQDITSAFPALEVFKAFNFA